MTRYLPMHALILTYLILTFMRSDRPDSCVQRMSPGPTSESQLVAVPTGTTGYALGGSRREQHLRRSWVNNSYVGILIGLSGNYIRNVTSVTCDWAEEAWLGAIGVLGVWTQPVAATLVASMLWLPVHFQLQYIGIFVNFFCSMALKFLCFFLHLLTMITAKIV